MKLSTRARYGARALLDLALQSSEGTVLLIDVARRQEVSALYLTHLVWLHVAAGIVKSTRGARSGVSLLDPPTETKLSEVAELLKGSIAPYDYVPLPNRRARGCCHDGDVAHHGRKLYANALGDGGENM